MRDLVIVGAGGHGRELLDIVEAINDATPTWTFLGFLDDDLGVDPERLARRSAPLLGPVALLAEMEADYVVGVGSSQVRAAVDALASAAGRDAGVLVHPLASVGGDVELSPGVVLAAGARVTTNVRIGRHTHLNINAVVSHDCRLGDYVTMSPGSLCNGNVTLEDHAFLGTAAAVTPGRQVGSGAVVGAGAVVVQDIPAGALAVGVPARVRGVR